jgi:pimeloyl-ACP methyl ester carboxylesterase
MRVIFAAAALLSLHAFQGPADQSPHTEHLFERDGIQLHYLDWGGQGDLLVFLTGYGATPHVFDGLAGQFRTDFRVVSPTRRGRQPSASPATGYALSDLTADVTALLDRLQISRVHLVAHSLAGAEATALAIEQPTRIVSIVYLDAALDAAEYARGCEGTRSGLLEDTVVTRNAGHDRQVSPRGQARARHRL